MTKLIVFIDTGDQAEDETDQFTLEIIADRIRGAVNDVVPVASVRVGKLYENVDDLVEEIRKEVGGEEAT